MTKRIEDLTGDQFVFEMDDVYRTGDEIEILANTFGKLSEQMEEYLRNILAMTAEKERVGTELALAARIQSDMLPNKFPPFPDRQEFTSTISSLLTSPAWPLSLRTCPARAFPPPCS